MANRLSLNLDKNIAILFLNRRHNIHNDIFLLINEMPFEFRKSEEFLGLIVDEDVKFDEHTSFVYSKVSKAVGIICKLREYVPTDVLLRLYYSIAYPYILYGNLV